MNKAPERRALPLSEANLTVEESAENEQGNPFLRRTDVKAEPAIASAEASVLDAEHFEQPSRIAIDEEELENTPFMAQAGESDARPDVPQGLQQGEAFVAASCKPAVEPCVPVSQTVQAEGDKQQRPEQQLNLAGGTAGADVGAGMEFDLSKLRSAVSALDANFTRPASESSQETDKEANPKQDMAQAIAAAFGSSDSQS